MAIFESLFFSEKIQFRLFNLLIHAERCCTVAVLFINGIPSEDTNRVGFKRRPGSYFGEKYFLIIFQKAKIWICAQQRVPVDGFAVIQRRWLSWDFRGMSLFECDIYLAVVMQFLRKFINSSHKTS